MTLFEYLISVRVRLSVLRHLVCFAESGEVCVELRI